MSNYKKKQREILNRPFPKKLAVQLAFMLLLAMGVVYVPEFFEVDPDEADVIVYHTKGCRCVKDWIWHLKNEGYLVAVQKVVSIGAVRKNLGIPADFSSCHTARAGDYFVEGHVPMNSVAALIEAQPAIAGIALPGKTDKENPETIEMGLPEEVMAFEVDGGYRPFNRQVNQPLTP